MGAAFMGLLLPIAVSACLACMAIADAMQPGQVVQCRRFGDAIDEFPGSFNADAKCMMIKLIMTSLAP